MFVKKTDKNGKIQILALASADNGTLFKEVPTQLAWNKIRETAILPNDGCFKCHPRVSVREAYEKDSRDPHWVNKSGERESERDFWLDKLQKVSFQNVVVDKRKEDEGRVEQTVEAPSFLPCWAVQDKSETDFLRRWTIENSDKRSGRDDIRSGAFYSEDLDVIAVKFAQDSDTVVVKNLPIGKGGILFSGFDQKAREIYYENLHKNAVTQFRGAFSGTRCDISLKFFFGRYIKQLSKTRLNKLKCYRNFKVCTDLKVDSDHRYASCSLEYEAVYNGGGRVAKHKQRFSSKGYGGKKVLLKYRLQRGQAASTRVRKRAQILKEILSSRACP